MRNTTIKTQKFGGSTTVITEYEIKTSGAQSVGDLLKLVRVYQLNSLEEEVV